MGHILMISEKPDAAKKIAYALGEKVVEKRNGKARYYIFERNNKVYVVVPAVGHLFSLNPIDNKKWEYPIFENKWVPTYEIDESLSYTKQYYENFVKFSKDAEDVIVCTDWDTEGSVIAYNILRFIAKRRNAYRMFFTTLTKSELIDSFEHKSPSLDFGMINAGLARHKLDWMYGINITRALTLALQKARGGFKIISTGRVQGPTLKMLVDREREIENFKPKKYWEISAVWGNKIKALHKEQQIFDKEKAQRIWNNCKDEKKGKVAKVVKREVKIPPPVPFNLTGLQTEAYRLFKYNPYMTQQIAQKLYINALISYPRTSSQKLPKRLNLPKIIRKLKGQKEYEKETAYLIDKGLFVPREGKKEDKAHTAIYPTGETPQDLSKQEKNVYDLIVRRFLATFGVEAIKESKRVELSIKDEVFVSKGASIKENGWRDLYGKYSPKIENPLPNVNEGDLVDIEKINMEEKETKPPERYSLAGIVKEMEKRGLGTKATRAAIVKTLQDRGYIGGERIKVSRLGIGVITALENHCPRIISEELTRKFELHMELISNNKEMKEDVIAEAEDILIDISNEFKANEENIGKELKKALEESWKENSNKGKVVGKCPVCNAELKIMYSKANKSEFVGCSNYPKCKTTYSLPKTKYKLNDKVCEVCGAPTVLVGKNNYILCLNKDCKSRKIGKCPNCEDGVIIVRVSKRGSIFGGCSNYPKCKTIYNLPKDAIFTEKKCSICGAPIVVVDGLELCLNKECSSHKKV